MSEEFVNTFLDFTKKIPSFKGGELVFLMFTIIHGKEKSRSKNIMVTKYEGQREEVELIMQSPKETVLEKVDQKKLKSLNMGGKKFYTGYRPEPKGFISIKGDFYTYINDYVWTAITSDKGVIKSIKLETPMKFQKDIVKYAKRFIQDTDNFSLCMLQWDKYNYQNHSQMIFFNPYKKTEMVVEIFKDQEDLIEIFWEEIEKKKKLDKHLYEGKGMRKRIFCSRLDKNRILVSKCTKGKKEVLGDITKKISAKLK